MKIGAINFDDEYDLIQGIRLKFQSEVLEIRVDANGVFSPKEAIEKLKKLSDLDLHSIEQPILPSQIDDMAKLCQISPLPIALDEELIGKYPLENKRRLLQIIKFTVSKILTRDTPKTLIYIEFHNTNFIKVTNFSAAPIRRKH